MWDPTYAATSVYSCALNWGEGTINISRDTVQPISPHLSFGIYCLLVYMHWLTVLHAVMLQLMLLSCSLQVFVSTCKMCSVEQGLFIYSPSLNCVVTEMSVRNTPDEQCHVYYTE